MVLCALLMVLAGGSQPAQPPLTRGEMAAVFARLEAAERSVLKLPAAKPKPPSKPADPAQRSDALLEFGRLYRLAKPSFSFTPRPIALQNELFGSLKGRPALTARELVSWGFLAPYGPLITQKAESMSLADFGDAVGFFLARLADLTHVPSERFSPYLGGVDLPPASAGKDKSK